MRPGSVDPGNTRLYRYSAINHHASMRPGSVDPGNFHVSHPKQVDFPHRQNVPENLERAVLRMKLVSAQQASQWVGVERLPSISNYFIGDDPKKWWSNVPNYGRVEARGVYPGVDLICYGDQGRLEYDLAVAPGADPNQVHLAWEGADSLRLNGDGDLVLTTRLGEIVQKRPRVYQDAGGKRVEIGSKYVLAAGNRVRFELASYDRSRGLVIDPLVLVYSTYLGGVGQDNGAGIAVDSVGSAYVTGATQSTNFPTLSAYEKYQGGYNAFVTKLSPAGNALVYSTYLGGSADDVGSGIAVDSAGSAYVTGRTTSPDFPTQSAYQAAYSSPFLGGSDAFVTKLTPTGNALAYSTYLGGGYDGGYGIVVDAAGSAYVTGQTGSINFPTQSAYQGLKGRYNAFVTKLAPAGNALVYSTFLGGSASDGGLGIVVDATGAAYVTGVTTSSDFPLEACFQSYAGGSDAFVTKLTPAGDALVYSTHLGGSGTDVGTGIAVDADGSAYITGYTSSTNFPTQSAFQTRLNGLYNAFVTKLTPAGSALVYSTYVGGNDNDNGCGIAVDAEGSAYITGNTSSTNFPLTQYIGSSGPQGEDAFVTKVSPHGTALVYSTYLGGRSGDGGSAIAVDAAGAVYVTGTTGSTDFPTESPFQETFGGGIGNAFVTKLSGYPSSQCLLTTNVTPSGGGRITVDRPSANGYYDCGTTVQLTAIPSTGSKFVSFSGDLNGSTSPQSLVISAPRSVTGNFALYPVLSVSMTHTGSFMQGELGVTYQVSVSNAATAGPTTGTVLVSTSSMDLIEVAMSGTGWTYSAWCSRSDPLAAGASYPPITVTMNVDSNAPASVTNSVTVSGGGSASAVASDPTTILPLGVCDLNSDGSANALDVKLIIKQALGLAPAVNHLAGDGVVNVVDAQIEINAARGLGCAAH